MRPETEEKLRKIKKISKVSQVICKVMLAVFACLCLAGIVGIVHGRGVTLNISGVQLPVAPLTLGARMVAAAIVVMAMGVWGSRRPVSFARGFFGNYGNGNIFTTDSGKSDTAIGHCGTVVVLREHPMDGSRRWCSRIP